MNPRPGSGQRRRCASKTVSGKTDAKISIGCALVISRTEDTNDGKPICHWRIVDGMLRDAALRRGEKGEMA